jgi:hypothetical protein
MTTDFSNPFDDIIGNVGAHIEQTTPFTCAVVSQEMILHDFGIPLTEHQLMNEAFQYGWLNEYGTALADMGKLLDLHGIENHIFEGGNINTLVNELAHGHRVIVGVDSGELWGGQGFWQRLTGIDNYAPDHALVVSGLDFSDPANPKVILNDPGTATGTPEVYPLDRFLEAWDDSNFTYCATDNSPADLQFQDTGFNADTGMYGMIGDWNDLFIRIGWDVGMIAAGMDSTGSVIDIFQAVNEAAKGGLFDNIPQTGLFG